MLVINGCKLFGRKKSGRYPHSVTLDEEHEERLAAIMLKDHRALVNAIERSIDVQWAMYSQSVRAELLGRVGAMREEAE